MADLFEIPLRAQPHVFAVTLVDRQYEMTVQWRDTVGGGWFLDVADGDGSPIVSGIALVTGADLLAQYAYLGIGGSLYVATDGDADQVPTFTNLGGECHLYFMTP